MRAAPDEAPLALSAEAHGCPRREGGLQQRAGLDGCHQGGDQQDEGLHLGRKTLLVLKQRRQAWWSPSGEPESRLSLQPQGGLHGAGGWWERCSGHD